MRAILQIASTETWMEAAGEIGPRSQNGLRAPLLAGPATAVELEFVIEISIAALFGNLLLKMLDGTGDIKDFDGTTVAADQVILVVSLAQAVMSRAAVKTNPPDDAVFFKLGDQAVDCGGIARDLEQWMR